MRRFRLRREAPAPLEREREKNFICQTLLLREPRTASRRGSLFNYLERNVNSNALGERRSHLFPVPPFVISGSITIIAPPGATSWIEYS